MWPWTPGSHFGRPGLGIALVPPPSPHTLQALVTWMEDMRQRGLAWVLPLGYLSTSWCPGVTQLRFPSLYPRSHELCGLLPTVTTGGTRPSPGELPQLWDKPRLRTEIWPAHLPHQVPREGRTVPIQNQRERHSLPRLFQMVSPSLPLLLLLQLQTGPTAPKMPICPATPFSGLRA